MKSIGYEKAFIFSVKIVNLANSLEKNRHEYTLSKQILRSGTSIAANMKEALYAQSKRDYIHKMSIALKEAAETEYWLDLLKETNYLDTENYNLLIKDNSEILKILISTIKTCKENLEKADRGTE